VNQAVRTLSRFEPVSTPAPLSHSIATPTNGHTIEAVRCFVGDDESDCVKAYYANRWLVVERDPLNNLIRESTGTYADVGAAFAAYWYASADEPLEFEAWVAPIFATHVSEAA
jgi:hypothetical protein